MNQNNIREEYDKWLIDLVCLERFSANVSFSKLLNTLHDTPFIYIMRMDSNRADDGVKLRRKFTLKQYGEDLSYLLEGPCSVLEMMIALSIRCEDTIMNDPQIGDRTRQWFWNMIVNLGLGSMYDSNYDERYVDKTIARFLNREYDHNGKGGLFTVRYPKRDLRKVEIWTQMTWYLGNII